LLILVNITVLALIAAGTWWLAGFDQTAAGDSKRGHHLTRALRCIAVVLLSAIFILLIESPASYAGIPILIIVPMCMAIVLRSALSEVFAQGFLRALDPELHDTREFDPKKTDRYRDVIARLIHDGHREEAIKLCEELKQSGEVDLVTLELTLEFLGVKQADRKPAHPLAKAARLRAQHKFAEAESLLQSLLQKNPADDGAAMMLMRMYAQDLRQPERAYQALQKFEKQPHVAAAHVEFARRSIPEWTTSHPGGTGVPPVESGVPPDSARAIPKQVTTGNGRSERPPLPPERPKPEAKVPFDPASLDQLLAQGGLGSAVETLEQAITLPPEDFGLRLKLAEVHVVHCTNFIRAERIVWQLEQAAQFAPEQVAQARRKLEEWRALAEARPA
jgi:tetratricopeptide (TPR) repeat protein